MIHEFNYSEIAESFDYYFTQYHFMTSRPGGIKKRFECQMSQIDFWINIQNLGISNDFTNDGNKFKTCLFYHLKKMGWERSYIKGRWKKDVYI